MSLIAEELTKSVIGGFFATYNELGYGFLEHTYREGLTLELRARGHRVAREVAVPIWYKGVPLTTQRLDMVVDDRLVIEIKSTEHLPPFARRQILNYLRATPLDVGLLLHFGPEPRFHRFVSSRLPGAAPLPPPPPAPDVPPAAVDDPDEW